LVCAVSSVKGMPHFPVESTEDTNAEVISHFELSLDLKPEY